MVDNSDGGGLAGSSDGGDSVGSGEGPVDASDEKL